MTNEQLEMIRSRWGPAVNDVRVLLNEIERLQELDAVFLDQPEDRLYHAEDQTWWKRVGDRLVSAEPPTEIRLHREQLNRVMRTLCHFANIPDQPDDDGQWTHLLDRIVEMREKELDRQ
jgi:hypothetical protein